MRTLRNKESGLSLFLIKEMYEDSEQHGLIPAGCS
jgi:hypothetical protein